MTPATPLHEIHRGLGASFTTFAGWEMPVRYQSEIAEHHAVRRRAGLFDLSHMGQIEVTGAGAAAGLDFAVVGTPSRIGVGRARYSMVCAEDGGVLDDLVVYRLEEERFLVVANAANVDTVFEALGERAGGFHARVVDRSADWSLVAVQGPRAAEILRRVSEADVDGLGYYAIDPTTVTGEGRSIPVLLARTGYTGEDGFELYCRPDAAVAVWSALHAAGEEHGLVPAGLACRDTLRLEAGMPLYGHELTRHVTPFDAGLGRVVAMDKEGGFVGREALARRRHQVGRRLVGLVSSSRRSPRAGYEVRLPGGSAVGEVTSGALSPTLERSIAMAYVADAASEPGTPLLVDVRGQEVEVVALPFYRRDR